MPVVKSEICAAVEPGGGDVNPVQPFAAFVAFHVTASAASSIFRCLIAASEMLSDHVSS